MNTICSEHNHVTVIIKVVDFCNFTCEFCRYPNNPHKMSMPFSTFKTIIEKACDYNVSHSCFQLSVIFHGGEPLLWGKDNFKSAIILQNELKEKHPGLIFRNSIQTNGSLLDVQWIDFFVKNNFDIGVSIDGPEEINFHRGPLGNDIVLDNIRKLAQKDAKFGILSVITNEHAGWADRYYSFLIENSIHSVGFCFCVYDEDKLLTVNNEVLSDFLKHFFELFYNGQYRLNVREFNGIIKQCLGIQTNSCTFAKRQRCGNFFSIRPSGDVFFCDPYKLDVSPLGNILKDSFVDITTNPKLMNIVLKAKEGAARACQHCEIKDICGGGCYRTALQDGENAFCETFKALYPYIKNKIQPYIP